MNFLANENFPYPGVVFLRAKGFFVKSITEEHPGISDEDVMKIAIEEGLIILTFDKDYGEIVFRYTNVNKPAIVYFREKSQTPLATAYKLIELISDNVIFHDRFTVVENNSYRQRLYQNG